MDAPVHFIHGGRGLDTMPLEATVGEARVVEIADRHEITVDELRPYELARRFPPDLVIRLDVDLDTASQRRPEDGRDYLEHRIGLVRALTFPGSLFGAVDVDATQPADKVLTAILRAIWSRL